MECGRDTHHLAKGLCHQKRNNTVDEVIWKMAHLYAKHSTWARERPVLAALKQTGCLATGELPNTAAASFSPGSNYSLMSTLDQSKCDWHRKEPWLSQCPLVQSSVPGIKSSILLAYKPGKTHQARAGFVSRPVIWLTMQLHKPWLKVWELQCSFNSSLHLSQSKTVT